MDIAVATGSRRASWLNLRTLLGIALFTIALVAGWSVLGAADRGVAVWAVARDLPEGARLSGRDVHQVEVTMPPVQLRGYLGAATGIEGTVLLRPVRQGELLAAEWVNDDADPASLRSVTIPITPDHAVGGALVPGDRVDVFATVTPEQPRARTELLVEGAEVEALATSRGLVVEGESLVGLTLAVPPEDIAKIVFAIRTAEIDVVRVEGATGFSGPTGVGGRDL